MSARRSVLPLVLLAFAAGVVLLQWQSVLPPVLPWIGAAVVVALGSVGAWATAARSSVPRGVVLVLAASCAGTLGFGYAAWRAEMRLAEALPAEWEGQDIALVGVVDELPQRSDRGTRFALCRGACRDVRRDRAPAAVARMVSRSGGRGPERSGPDLVAGERWRLVVRLKRPHGNVNPHGFDIEAWLLENGLRATGYVRNDERNARLDAFAGRASD